MKFQVGELVWITSAFKDAMCYAPPAMIVSAYEDLPRIFIHNKEENQRWLEEEDISTDEVYDILHCGSIEIAVMSEWLRPWSPH